MLDNATNNNTFARALENEQSGDEFLSFTEAENRLRCFAHVVNLAVEAGLEDNSFKELVKKVGTRFKYR